jgi:hypothetical protein
MEPRDIDQAGFCALYLFEAQQAVNEIYDPSPWSDRLPQFEERLKQIAKAARTARGLPIPLDW